MRIGIIKYFGVCIMEKWIVIGGALTCCNWALCRSESAALSSGHSLGCIACQRFDFKTDKTPRRGIISFFLHFYHQFQFFYWTFRLFDAVVGIGKVKITVTFLYFPNWTPQRYVNAQKFNKSHVEGIFGFLKSK